jgi:hypothetical protein
MRENQNQRCFSVLQLLVPAWHKPKTHAKLTRYASIPDMDARLIRWYLQISKIFINSRTAGRRTL